jgi:hypothetical protein
MGVPFERFGLRWRGTAPPVGGTILRTTSNSMKLNTLTLSVSIGQALVPNEVGEGTGRGLNVACGMVREPRPGLTGFESHSGLITRLWAYLR